MTGSKRISMRSAGDRPLAEWGRVVYRAAKCNATKTRNLRRDQSLEVSVYRVSDCQSSGSGVEFVVADLRECQFVLVIVWVVIVEVVGADSVFLFVVFCPGGSSRRPRGSESGLIRLLGF